MANEKVDLGGRVVSLADWRRDQRAQRDGRQRDEAALYRQARWKQVLENDAGFMAMLEGHDDQPDPPRAA